MNRVRTILRRLLRHVPPAAVRAIGRWQYRIPPLRWATERCAGLLTARRDVIAHGVGAGLRFDGTGGQPGYLLGTAEPAEQELLSRILGPGSVFYDIGANIGFYSTLAGRLVGTRGHVYAFEPVPSSARQARLNADLNGFDHVSVVEAAVCDITGTTTMQLGMGSTTHKLAVEASDEGISVRAISIDEWRVTHGAAAPTVVMIDVEGAELEVLRGMAGTISAHKPIILCEVHWLGSEFEQFVQAELCPLGYRMTALAGERPGSAGRWHAVLQVPR